MPTDIGTVTFMLFLQMIMKCGRIAMWMSRCRFRFEATKMTQKVASLITFITHKLLFLRFRWGNHRGVCVKGVAQPFNFCEPVKNSS